MKLNLNARELLALHNMLQNKFDGPCAHDEVMWKESDPRGQEQAALRVVYNRIRTCILSAINGQGSTDEDQFVKWMAEQQEKIEDLEAQNEELKPAKGSFDDLLDEGEDDDYVPYPRSKSPGTLRKGKPHVQKR